MWVIKIKKIILVLAFLLCAGLVSGANVCVVVDYKNGNVDSECVDVEDNADGYEVLEATSFDIEWKDWGALLGHSLCKINGVGRDADNCFGEIGDPYWNFNIVEDGKWSHALVGFDGTGGCSVHYCAKDEDIIGFSWGTSGAKPEMLKIKDLKAYVDGDKKSGADEDGGRIKDVKPGSRVKLKIGVENLYSEETDIEINDVFAKAIIKDIDDGDDIEEESGDVDLDPEDEETLEIEFEIPLEVEDNDYDLELTIEGEDEKGIEYEQIIDFTLEVEKEKHELLITRASLSNTKLKCSRTTQLSFNVMNLGTDKEDVTLTIFNYELELNKQESFTLDDDPFDSESGYSNTYTIKIDKEQKAGVYPVIVRVEYNGETKEKIIDITLEDCEDSALEASSETITQQESYTESTPITTAAVAETQKQPKSNLLTPMLIISANILAIIAVILIFLKVFRK